MLNNPVAPSNYVAPNRVRCKLPYTGAPDTDELTGLVFQSHWNLKIQSHFEVQFGEILIVHDQPEDDWIWAESVLTGNSGSVSIEMVEPVDPTEDPFLGYIWFNCDRAKVECK